MCFNTSVWPDLKAVEGLADEYYSFLKCHFFKTLTMLNAKTCGMVMLVIVFHQ